MSVEFKKRLFSSIIILPTILIIIFEGKFFFNSLLIIFFLISLYEWIKLSKNKIYKLIGIFFLVISYFSIYKLRNFFVEENFNLFIFYYIVTLCIATDLGGYIFGKLIEGPKLTKISPNKTIAGALGAIFLSFIFSLFFYKKRDIFHITIDVNFFNLMVIPILISIVSQIGDLCISFFKRKANVKDTGNLIPGHGGILDRTDGILLVFPLVILILFFLRLT